MEELIKFLKSSASGGGSRNFFEAFFNADRSTFFHYLAHVFKLSNLIVMKILL